MEKVIYAAYGSNLLKERFLAYIKGYTYDNHPYRGCSDKSDPVERGWLFIPRKLYFAKKSKRWENKGVAFISCNRIRNKKYYTLVRLWEITRQQFKEIQEQEGAWYSKEVEIGRIKGIPLVTFTGCFEDEQTRPSEKYLAVIKKGIKETTNWDDWLIDNYLKKFF